jgi:hypothetical protein
VLAGSGSRCNFRLLREGPARPRQLLSTSLGRSSAGSCRKAHGQRNALARLKGYVAEETRGIMPKERGYRGKMFVTPRSQHVDNLHSERRSGSSVDDPGRDRSRTHLMRTDEEGLASSGGRAAAVARCRPPSTPRRWTA